MSKLAIANWKMNSLANEGRKLISDLSEKLKGKGADIIICPPFTIISTVGETMRDTGFKLGAQDCHHENEGAFTGDISARMLADLRCNYVILGHSERRKYHNESSELVGKKVMAAVCSSIAPIICIGENLECREAGNQNAFVTEQLEQSLPPNLDLAEVIIAYEPIWAIGTGRVAEIEQIDEMHSHIKAYLTKKSPHNQFKIVYGGSVNELNSKDIMALDAVDGVLVGGASLKSEVFSQIALTAAKP